MQWLKNNLVCLIIILVLVFAGIWGICFAGRSVLEAQSLAGELVVAALAVGYGLGKL